MKKITLFAFALMLTPLLNAQTLPQEPAAEEYNEAAPRHMYYAPQAESGRSVIFSEDFANGIPSTWSQNGSPAMAVWEYRGPGTSPDNTVGSIGCWAGPNTSGNQGDPINSPSASNGFVIFDSDFYHSNGDRNTNGSGPIPAPHAGRLNSNPMDFTNEPYVELSFYTYLRRFQASFYIALSIDNGNTFIDTLEIFPFTELSVNSSSAENVNVLLNISNIVGGHDSVVVQFFFDGTSASGSGSGRYFWMLDDIEFRVPPDNLMLFTAATAPGTTGNAPAHDIIYDSNSSYPKYLNVTTKQSKPIFFDSNILNYGIKPQSNVALEVEIRDASGNLETTLSTPTTNLSSLDTGYYTTFTTTAGWTPTSDGEYSIIYKAVSDSITSSTTSTADTFKIYVGDVYGLDDREDENYFGTNTGTNGMVAIGFMASLENEDTSGTLSNKVYFSGVEMNMSNLTDSTADMEIAIYDTAGFRFNDGFPNTSTPIAYKVFSFDGSIPGTVANFSFEDSNGDPQELATGTYYVIATFFPNAQDGVVRLANTSKWNQPSYASVFQNGNGDWFSGFSNSTTYESPHMRLIIADAPAISLKEDDLGKFSVYPNPTSGKGTVEFGTPGNYKMRLYNMVGDLQWEQEARVNANEQIKVDFSSVSRGVYLLTINGESSSKTIKVNIH